MTIRQWEAKVNRSQEEFDTISKAIKSELERFELQRVKDFKTAFILYLEAQLKAQEKVSRTDFVDDVQVSQFTDSIHLQVIEHWETYMPEAKAIAWVENWSSNIPFFPANVLSSALSSLPLFLSACFISNRLKNRKC